MFLETNLTERLRSEPPGKCWSKFLAFRLLPSYFQNKTPYRAIYGVLYLLWRDHAKTHANTVDNAAMDGQSSTVEVQKHNIVKDTKHLFYGDSVMKERVWLIKCWMSEEGGTNYSTRRWRDKSLLWGGGTNWRCKGDAVRYSSCNAMDGLVKIRGQR